MIGFSLAGLTSLLTGAIAIIVTEVYGVLKTKAQSADPVKAWTLADRWLEAHYPIADWVFRIATVVFLAYTVLRVAASVP